MYWTLRTISLKRILPYSAALLLLALLLGLLTGFAPLRLLGGAVDLKDVDLDTPAGTFVQADAVKLFDAFAELGSGENVKAVDCVISTGDGRVLALCLPARLIEQAEEQMQQTYSWLISQGPEPRYGFRVRGELVPLTGEELEAYLTWLEGNSGRLVLGGAEAEGDYREHTLPYILRVDMLGGIELWLLYIVTVLFVLCGTAALFLILAACLGLFQVSARLYVQRNKKALKLRTAQNDFEMAEKVGDARVGQSFTWFFSGPVTKCLKNSSVAWAYVGGGKGRTAVLYTSSGERQDVTFPSRRKAERFLAALQEGDCAAVFGFSPQARAQFKDWLTRKMLRRGGKA